MTGAESKRFSSCPPNNFIDRDKEQATNCLSTIDSTTISDENLRTGSWITATYSKGRLNDMSQCRERKES